MRIGVDAMGGDYAPEAVVKGAVLALGEIGRGCRIFLFGDKGRIEEIARSEGADSSLFEIINTTQVIGFDDNPAVAFGKKPDSSLAVGFGYLKEGMIDGFASAGSTGAMLVGSMLAVKPVAGVIRPTISSVVPTVTGKKALILDVGLNVDCKPEVLVQYGLIGSLYADYVMGIENPRVALLNIGEESEKGDIATKTAHEMMSGTDKFNFVGNIEAKQIFTGKIADVVVCDGFVGNVVLKQTEGLYEILKDQGVANDFIDSLNYELYGGTPVLGVNGNIMVGHGCSTPVAIKNMILQTEKMARSGIIDRFRKAFG